MNQLFLFNPGNEASYMFPKASAYTPPSIVRRMEQDLSSVFAALGTERDAVFCPSSKGDLLLCAGQPAIAYAKERDLPRHRISNEAMLLCPWGPQAFGFANYQKRIEKLGQKLLPLAPEHPHVRNLIDRTTAARLMRELSQNLDYPAELVAIPFHSSSEITNLPPSFSGHALAKQPYSSSGRGIIPLSIPLSTANRQAIDNALLRSGHLMLERRLDRVADLASEWVIEKEGQVYLCGYSAFRTTERGSYIGNWLYPQEEIRQRLSELVGGKLLRETERRTKEFIERELAPFYHGLVGIDQLIYRNNDRLAYYPAVEINLRMTMGHLAIKLAERLLSPGSRGVFRLGIASGEDLPTPSFDSDGLLRTGAIKLSSRAADARFEAIIVAQQESSAPPFNQVFPA
ncbi:hypothetical protein HQ45_04300 [Porphyromonas crevioricanis]|nr:hypothetical protein [Porphyromonas crevioricanis]KGN90045.1 hypothetical protein HQ45_04300 [Porphyromonas crevioricanis]